MKKTEVFLHTLWTWDEFSLVNWSICNRNVLEVELSLHIMNEDTGLYQ